MIEKKDFCASCYPLENCRILTRVDAMIESHMISHLPLWLSNQDLLNCPRKQDIEAEVLRQNEKKENPFTPQVAKRNEKYRKKMTNHEGVTVKVTEGTTLFGKKIPFGSIHKKSLLFNALNNQVNIRAFVADLPKSFQENDRWFQLFARIVITRQEFSEKLTITDKLWYGSIIVELLNRYESNEIALAVNIVNAILRILQEERTVSIESLNAYFSNDLEASQIPELERHLGANHLEDKIL
jgi:hypothetical protein